MANQEDLGRIKTMSAAAVQALGYFSALHDTEEKTRPIIEALVGLQTVSSEQLPHEKAALRQVYNGIVEVRKRVVQQEALTKGDRAHDAALNAFNGMIKPYTGIKPARTVAGPT